MLSARELRKAKSSTNSTVHLRKPKADIIFFGSSFVRSGISPEPFLKRGLLPLNLAVSGGGPLYAYYTLRRIAPVLKRRERPPVLVLEINAMGLIVRSGWDEY